MHIELHILQNFAPSCLNRDDTNTPKDCTFGGVRRARLSSQSLKRAIRTSPVFREGVDSDIGTRTRLLAKELVRRLVERGRSEDAAMELSILALTAAGYKMDGARSAVLLFLSPGELGRYADLVDKHWDALVAVPAAEEPDPAAEKPKKGAKAKKDAGPKIPKELETALKALGSDKSESADIALFGRMIAESTNMNIVAACQVAHAISTHEVRPEADFFTAVDDLQPRDETGAGMMGTVEFNSACYYRYASVDVEQLSTTLSGDREQAKRVALAFLRAAIVARPSAKQASMAAHNPPSYVLVRVRDHGAPCALTNAFVRPIRVGRDEDLAEASMKALEHYDTQLTSMYGAAGLQFSASTSTFAQPESGSVEDLLGKVEKALV